MPPEKLSSIRVSPKPHGQQLLRGPLVQVDRADKRDVDAQSPVGGRAVVTDKYTVCRGCPGRIARRTIKANLLESCGIQADIVD